MNIVHTILYNWSIYWIRVERIRDRKRSIIWDSDKKRIYRPKIFDFSIVSNKKSIISKSMSSTKKSSEMRSTENWSEIAELQ